MAAKVILQEYDFSSFVPSMSGIKAAIVVNSSKGDIDTPRFVTDVDQYIAHFGLPHPSRGVSEYSAITYLTYGGPMYVVRSAHNTDNGRLPGKDPKYPAMLVRSKVAPIPNGVPDPDYEPQRVTEPLKNGLTQHELDAFNFPLYRTHRKYEFEDCGIMQSALNSNEVKVFSFEDLEEGNDISLTPTIYVAEDVKKGSKEIKVNDTSFCNPDQNIEILGTELKMEKVDHDNNVITLEFPLEFDLSKDFPIHIVPYDLSAYYNIKKLDERVIDYDLLTLGSPITANKAEPVRLVKIAEKKFSEINSDYEDITVDDQVDSKTITVNTTNGVTEKQTLRIDGDDFIVSKVDADNKKITFKLLDGQVLNVANGDSVTLMQRTYKTFEDPVFVVRSVKASTQLIVTNSDYIKNEEIIAVGSGLTTSEEEAVLKAKDLYRETQKWIVLDKPVIAYTNYRIYKMVHSEYEDRDAFLVTALNQGVWGNDIEIKISDSKLPEAFYLEIYNDGVSTGEKFHCSMKYMKDGFGNQLFIENVINGKSNFIKVKVNPADVDENGTPKKPLTTDYSLWRKDPIDIFLPLTKDVKIEEDVILNDVEIMVNDNAQFKLGNRIRFEGFDGEYKILDVTEDVDGNKVIKLDRRIIVDKIPNGTRILRFAYTKYFPITKLDKAFPGYVVPCDFLLAGESGKLLDAGINNLKGGDLGSAVTIGDLMRTADSLNKDRYKFQLLLDGGFAYPAYQQKLVTIAEKIMTCFAYLTTDVNAELSVNYIDDVIGYRNKTMINSSWAGIFTPHVKIYDQYNQMEVWVSPEAFAASKQAYVDRNVVMWMPAAGWQNGKILVLDLVRKYNQDEIDLLTDEHQINCLKYEDGDGVAIWGNETMLTMPSYLQMRHVRMLLIVVETGLKSFLKYETFQMNDDETRGIIVFKLNKWFKEALSKAVYAFKIIDATNDNDVNNRRGVFRIMFSPKTSMEEIVSQVVITSKGFDFGLVNI
jgi:hypothetical protein